VGRRRRRANKRMLINATHKTPQIINPIKKKEKKEKKRKKERKNPVNYIQ
jgi:hypothetical protein